VSGSGPSARGGAKRGVPGRYGVRDIGSKTMSDTALRIAIMGEVACGPKAATRARRQAVAPPDLRARIERGEPVVVLDVRESPESAAAPFGNGEVVCIPLSELRERLSELPRDRQIVCLCPMGIGAYETSTILIGDGFPQVVYSDGGMRVFSAVKGGES